MTEKKYVEYGNCCKTSCGKVGGIEGITGCRFSLSVMSDHYIDIILEAIRTTDTSQVYALSDKLSTVYRGKRAHVLDALKACFIHAYLPNIHMVLEATISKGCPGDCEGESFLNAGDQLMNRPHLVNHHFDVLAKISLYPMGIIDYMPHIAHVVNEAVDRGIYDHSAHYVTVLKGDVHLLFDYFQYITDYCTENLGHYVLEITCSINSPTK